MIDMNMVIIDNIKNCLVEQDKKQVNLALYLNVSRQTMSKMLSGNRMMSSGKLNAA